MLFLVWRIVVHTKVLSARMWRMPLQQVSRPAKNLVYALFQVLRILLPTERGLVARFKDRQCIDECEVKSAISRRYLEHVKQLSLIQEGLGSRLGLYFRVVGTHALGTVPSFYHLPLSQGVLVRF
jgi:hypothetical protein